MTISPNGRAAKRRDIVNRLRVAASRFTPAQQKVVPSFGALRVFQWRSRIGRRRFQSEGRQEAPAPEAPALPAVLERDEFRIEEWTSLRSILRRNPGKRTPQVMDLALHLPGLIALGARIRRAGFGGAARTQPALVFKYLGWYLAKSFGTAARLRILSHHYQTLAARLPDLGKLGFPRNEIVLWSHGVELDTFTIGLCMPAYLDYLEGDLSLVLSVNGIRLHRLSFTCIPGKEAGLEVGTALLVGGSQGFPGTSALIRQASKTIGEICPAAMLILALQALAKRLGADAILGITADEQTCLRANPEQAKSRYDSFWEISGGERQGRFYRLPGGVAWTDTSHLSNGHRARARRKRELKERILAQIRENAERLFSASDRLPVVLFAAFSIS
jgi:uncharacterized protein